MPHTHRLKPGHKVKLAEISTRGKDFHKDREGAEKEFEELKVELAKLQEKLYAESKQKVLVVLQAMDTGGKDSTIRNVFSGVNPQGVQVSSFKVPTADELAHDFLWRIHQRVPANGYIGIFNRSHYEDVIIVRVANLLPESVWRPRYELINQFEQLLAHGGTRVLKFYLHISEDEQKQRLKDRLDDPRKNWKFSAEDLRKRKEWKEYMELYEEASAHGTSDDAPWNVIPADQKW
ncbi:MAG: polyphosphate kinase 2 family protein [Planctomycetales bacterium]|nr:polyphosphate kinase 2 family protein [Planctomycetales bacterium]